MIDDYMPEDADALHEMLGEEKVEELRQQFASGMKHGRLYVEQSRCPHCHAAIDSPVIRSIDGDLANLDYHCPACDYRYARWPKAGVAIGEDS